MSKPTTILGRIEIDWSPNELALELQFAGIRVHMRESSLLGGDYLAICEGAQKLTVHCPAGQEWPHADHWEIEGFHSGDLETARQAVEKLSEALSAFKLKHFVGLDDESEFFEYEYPPDGAVTD